ncbi:uncharacterized protein LOC112555363 isoform X2 [Pomacea canaliculata]|uniref:uncharacterized protein LOC112555363 isoform X2 n=1 Tax=Pomacea canaliculata TaxID=400727 RepID=UPI000D73143F|nr:uncharacterized protein LOC112555363 isoform X2 [Pomacea canaliculata]
MLQVNQAPRDLLLLNGVQRMLSSYIKMAGRVQAVAPFVILCLWAAVQSSDICRTPRWFGPNCVYRCQCKNDYEDYYCLDSNGACRCGNGYAGTSCQYENYAALASTRVENVEVVFGNMASVTDGNEVTCFAAKIQPNVKWTAELSSSSWVTHIKLIVRKGSAGPEDLTVSCYNDVDNTETRVTPRQANNNDTELVYPLNPPSLVSKVQISTSRDAQLALCEVYILGGRNLALKKNASQGEETFSSQSGAEKAVDGNIDRTTSCTQTKGTSMKSWWKVVLGNNLLIWRIEVHNKDGQYSWRLRYFEVGATLRNESFQLLYKDTRADIPSVTSINLERPVAATEVNISLPDSGIALTLCEVRIFGDCLDYFHGWKCEERCNCEDSGEICEKMWGSCPVSGCKSGWQGLGCREPCGSGTFGFQCSSNCSDTCVERKCQQISGECTNGCKPGWEGDKCDRVCPINYFGERCSRKCGEGCANSRCHHITGKCTQGCNAGWQGATCSSPCDSGFFGLNCSLTCSIGCLNTTCDASSGTCSYGCADGFGGDTCVSEDLMGDNPTDDDNNSIIIGVTVGVLFLILLLITIGLIVWRIRKRNPETKSQRKTGVNSVTPIGLLMDSPDNANNILQPLNSPNTDFTCKRSNSMSPAKPPRRRLTEKREAFQMEEQSGLVSPDDKAAVRSSKREKVESSSGAESSRQSLRSSSRRPQLMALFSRDATSTGDTAITRARASRRGASFESLDELSTVDTELMAGEALPWSGQPVHTEGYYNVVFRDKSPNTLVSLEELPARVAKWMAEPRLFNRERGLLPVGKIASWEAATLPENIRKNRYREVYPYDHSRVRLTPLTDDPTSDYYNACYIDGYNKERQYIAAQGPMEKTLADFLRMVWDVDCPCIVMLTNTVEMGRFKCEQYWPAEGVDVLSVGSIKVTVSKVTTLADYCVRELILERDGQTRRVAMFHYTAWPDNYAPASPWSLLDFRFKVHQAALTNGPTIVHCSAGIGRTGTFLTLDIQLSRAEHEDSVDVFTCVWNLRQQRISMVQTLAQYIFIYEVLAANLMTSLPVPIKDFNLSYLLQERDGKRLIEEEFQKLELCLAPPKEGSVVTEETENDSGATSDGMELPRDVHRVPVFSADGKFSSVYVNAVFQSSYRQSQAFIQTHSPLEGKVVDFLSMVFQHQATAVICLDSTEGNQGVSYWPDTKGSSVKLGPYRVELLGIKEDAVMTIRALRIYLPGQYNLNSRKSVDPTKETWHEVTHITCSLWPDCLLTSEYVSTFVAIVKTVHPEPQRPVLVHCRDGHTRSGVFCVLYAVLERLKAEGKVAVSYVTPHMRSPRRQNVTCLDQYEFLYRCVQHQLDVQEEDTTLFDQSSRDVVESSEENAYGNVQCVGGSLKEKTPRNVQAPVNTEEEPLYSNTTPCSNSDESKLQDSNIYSNLQTH